jgi:hypothetical protein
MYYAYEWAESIRLYVEGRPYLPHNSEYAREVAERIVNAIDNLRSGFISDFRLHYEAHPAFGRGQSLDRARRLSEAKTEYISAIQKIAQVFPLILNWTVAGDGLDRIARMEASVYEGEIKIALRNLAELENNEQREKKLELRKRWKNERHGGISLIFSR